VEAFPPEGLELACVDSSAVVALLHPITIERINGEKYLLHSITECGNIKQRKSALLNCSS
jgi:hypothetical protein